jgi:hypothetical protein
MKAAHICRDALPDRAEVAAQISATEPAFWGSYRSDDLWATAACEPRPYRASRARLGKPEAGCAAGTDWTLWRRLRPGPANPLAVASIVYRRFEDGLCLDAPRIIGVTFPDTVPKR